MQADASVVAADADNDFAEADAGVFADVATSDNLSPVSKRRTATLLVAPVNFRQRMSVRR